MRRDSFIRAIAGGAAGRGSSAGTVEGRGAGFGEALRANSGAVAAAAADLSLFLSPGACATLKRRVGGGGGDHVIHDLLLRTPC